mgnify:CR=1 FL=1|tara:strand:+ start:15735 stop:17687 length:1953 start_codon:yes stop_codon:yes gene_type:complete
MPSVISAIIQVVQVLISVGQVVAAVASVATLFTKAKSSSKTKAGTKGLALMVREPDYPRRVLYGAARVGGIWFYAETTGDSNEQLWLVLGVAEGPTKGPVAVYFGEDRIDLETLANDLDGHPIYTPRAAEAFFLETKPAFVDGPGAYALYEALDPTSVEVLEAAYNAASIGDPEGGEVVTGKRVEAASVYAGFAGFSFYTGSQTTADRKLSDASAGNWTADCKLLGISYVVVQLIFDADIYSAGVPQISFLWEGRTDVYDPRSDASSYSRNAALCLSHYLTLARLGPNADYVTEIAEPALIESANACDEQVLTLAGDEIRYAFDGVVSVADTPEDNLGAMLSAMGGYSSYAGGRFTLGAAVWNAPTFEITTDLIVKIDSFQTRAPKRSRVNTVKGLFLSPANLYQSSDFPTQTNAAYVTEDGEELVADIELNFTSTASTAQRLAKIQLEDYRLQRSLQIECTLEAFRAQAGKNVLVTIERYGLAQVPFEVEASSFVVADDGALLVRLTLGETASAIYDWTTADETLVEDTPPLDMVGLKVAPPTATPPALVDGYPAVDYPKSITLSTLTTGASIRWSKTFAPDSIGSGAEYVAAISVSEGETIFAAAFRKGYEDSETLVATYIGEVFVIGVGGGDTFGVGGGDELAEETF